MANGVSSRRCHGRRSGIVMALAILALFVSGAALAAGKGKSPDAALSSEPTPTEQPVPPPPEASAQAHYSFARQMFAKQEYVAAAQALERAYARDPRSLYLFNAAQAYRKGARYQEALKAYERFLSISPNDAMAPDARDHVRTLQIMLAQEERQKQIELTMEQTQLELERVKSPPITRRIWFWAAIVGVGVTVIAIGAGAKVVSDQRATDTGIVALQF